MKRDRQENFFSRLFNLSWYSAVFQVSPHYMAALLQRYGSLEGFPNMVVP